MTAEDYLNYLRARGRKQTTIEGYTAAIKACEKCLAEGGMRIRPEEINEDTFYFLRNNLGMKETTMQVRMRAYSQYIEWATGINWMKRAKVLWNPLQYDVVFISKDQYSELLCFSFYSPHIRMMLLLGGLMGLRRTEIASIKIGDLRPDKIIIHGKGHGEEGNVQDQHIPKEMVPEIQHYLSWRKKKLEEDNIVTDDFIIFTEKYGHVSLPEYRNAAISWTFKKLSEDTGIRVTPHSLRRLYATTLYNDGNGADIKTIAKLMRHANPNVTWRYIQQNERKSDEISDGIVRNLGVVLNMSSTMLKYPETSTPL